MDELETYRQQREQIELALVDDPENTELLKLKQDLTDLVDLMAMARGGAGAGGGGKEAASSSKADKRRRGAAAASADAAPPDGARASPVVAGAVGAQASPTAPGQPARSPVGASPAREWKVGEKCKARWSQDGKFYDALITAASETGVYSVTFTEYGDVALVRAHDLRPLHGGAGAQASTGYKRWASDENPAGDAAASADPAGPGAANGAGSQQKSKKKKGAGKSEVAEKQNAWLSFAKKGPKAPHGKKASLLSKKSMFSTPDNPNAKVKHFKRLVLDGFFDRNVNVATEEDEDARAPEAAVPKLLAPPA
ncbi:MAG: hypothetical protein BJ554DRAFT_3208 [Olpidium bornovanus]|uniref:Tudor domain-containing protein n=1 Tax=Olpidium bornovanus TaxID=278681 RepID=A0A8H7ZP55_9FUNG|nr:MAG: hypothetical protein BJ554DRAFT_3208 [Olpidium bornovanus]